MHDYDSLESGSGPIDHLVARTPDQVDPQPVSGPAVLVDVLPPKARIVVTTKHSCYRFVVIDGADRRVCISGGKMFPEAKEVRLEGATAAEGSIKPGWIGVGLRVELWDGSRRITTSPVESVAFERIPVASQESREDFSLQLSR